MDTTPDPNAARSLLDDSMLDRIIGAVGVTPPQFDRDALRLDLLVCYGKYSRAVAARSGFIKDQYDRLDSIRNHAKRLVKLLDADDADLGIIQGAWPLSSEHPAHLRTQIAFLVELIDGMPGLKEKPADLAKRMRTRQGISGTALQFLINTWLRAPYEKHFGKEAKIGRNKDGTVSGPYFRFVRQVVTDWKIKCSDETIASYLEKPEKLL
jgi:hypothetical protein